MTDYAHGSSAILGSRSDLGKIADRYMEQYSAAERVALRATGTKFVTGGGAVRFLAKSFWQTDDADNDPGFRFPDMSIPKAQKGSTTTLNVLLRDYGREVTYDVLSPDTQMLRAEGGDAHVESVYTAKATTMTAESMDNALSKVVGATATPWTATEINASGTQWDDPVNDAVAQINECIINLDGEVDSVLLSRKASNLLRNCSDVVQGYGGNTGAGIPLDLERFSAFWASFGITNVLIGDTDLFTSFVTIYRGASADPEISPAGLVLCRMRLPGENEHGMVVSVDEYNHGKTIGIYAPITGDMIAVPPLGNRIKNVY